MVRNLVELDTLSGAPVVVEKVDGDGGPLVLDGGRRRKVGVHQGVQLAGAEGRVELEGRPEGGLEDIEAAGRRWRGSRHLYGVAGSDGPMGRNSGSCAKDL